MLEKVGYLHVTEIEAGLMQEIISKCQWRRHGRAWQGICPARNACRPGSQSANNKIIYQVKNNGFMAYRITVNLRMQARSQTQNPSLEYTPRAQTYCAKRRRGLLFVVL